MALRTLQVTIGTAATRFSTSDIPIVWARIESDDGNSNPCFIGDSTVAATNGQRLNNSATVPEDMVIGPFSLGQCNLNEFYVAGTQGEKVNVLYVPY